MISRDEAFYLNPQKILFCDIFLLRSHLLKKSLMENFIFCSVTNSWHEPAEHVKTTFPPENVQQKC